MKEEMYDWLVEWLPPSAANYPPPTFWQGHAPTREDAWIDALTSFRRATGNWKFLNHYVGVQFTRFLAKDTSRSDVRFGAAQRYDFTLDAAYLDIPGRIEEIETVWLREPPPEPEELEEAPPFLGEYPSLLIVALGKSA